eukprot:1848241-Amphidinium_carterae.1
MRRFSSEIKSEEFLPGFQENSTEFRMAFSRLFLAFHGSMRRFSSGFPAKLNRRSFYRVSRRFKSEEFLPGFQEVSTEFRMVSGRLFPVEDLKEEDQ